MSDEPGDTTVDADLAVDPDHSSRRSRRAAGWDCKQAASVKELFRPGYKQKDFTWISLRPILQSRNDRIARWLEDPTDEERARWVAAMQAKGVDPDLVVRRYADKETISFLLLGDPGEGDASQYHVLTPMRSKEAGTSFMYVVSDVIYPAGDVNEYEDKFFWPYREFPGPIYAIPGNHDWYDGLHGFMTHFCQADPDLRPEASGGGGWRRRLRKLVWRRPSKADQQVLERIGKLRAERSDQAGPYFALEAGPILLVGIDTGIRSRLDSEQGEWLRRISRHPKPKILLSGKPLVADASRRAIEIEGLEGGVRRIVEDREHRYIAVIAGDVHNYQRYLVNLPDGRKIPHIVTGAAGAFTKGTHEIPNATPALCGCTEQEFRCYPRRGDSLAAYSKLYRDRFWFAQWFLDVPFEKAPATMSELMESEVPPTRAVDAAEDVTPKVLKAAKRVERLPTSGGAFHANFSELLDWNDPPPPLFKSFLRADVKPDEIVIRCFAATGCAEHADDPPLEDWIRGRPKADGTWAWEVLLT